MINQDLILNRFPSNFAKAIFFTNPKSQHPMRENGKKTHLRQKKNIEPIFGNVNEGDEIKKTLGKFLEKLMRATK